MQCPFCPIFGVAPQPVGNDFYGEQPALIGGIPSCQDCKIVSEQSDEIVKWMLEEVDEDLGIAALEATK